MLNKRLATHEFDLILNMYKHQEELPKIFERMDIKFFQPDHKEAIEFFRAMALMWRDSKQINETSLEFKVSGFINDDVATAKYMSKLKTNKVITSWEDDVNFILFEWKRREVQNITDKLQIELKKEYVNFNSVNFYTDKIIETVEEGLEEEETIEDLLTSQPIIEFKNETMKRLFHGILRKNINVIGGDTGHTKTTLTIFMINEWLERGYKVLMFPIDGDYKETMQKLASLRTKINSNLIVESNFSKETPTGRMTQEEFDRIKKEMYDIKKKFLDKRQLVIRDKETELSEIKLWIRKEKPDIVIIDTIQAMNMPGGDETQIQHGAPIILKHLKQIAKQLDIAILLVAWMETQGKRPETWQIWFTKVIDKYAAKIWMLYYFYKVQKIPAFKNIIEIIYGKQRFGEVGIKIVGIVPEYGEYTQLDVTKDVRANYKKLSKLPFNWD